MLEYAVILDARQSIIYMSIMKFIASRVLAAGPGRVWVDLEKEGALVTTKDGVPRSIMVPTSDATLLDDVQEIVFARARKAVREIRKHATETGAVALTTSDVDHEIKASRRARRQRAEIRTTPPGRNHG